MTWNELVQQHVPGCSDDDALIILWELTAWPCCGFSYLTKQLAEVGRRLAAGASLGQLLAETISEAFEDGA